LEGNEKRYELTHPDEEWFYFLCADRFGWTPSVVDEQPAYLMDWLLSIAVLTEQVKSDKYESNSRKTERR